MANRGAGSRQYAFDPTQLEPFEIGAAATVILCWPGARQQPVREEMHVKIAALLLRASVGNDDEAQITPRLMKPIYAFRDVERDLDHMERFEQRLASALHVGNLAMPFLRKAHDGADVRFPGMEALTIASLARAVGDAEDSWVDPANFRKRVWQPWLPVVHLAAAARIVLQECRKATGREPEWLAMMTDPALIGRWLIEARALEVTALRAFPQIGNGLVRIDLVGVTCPRTD